MLQVRMGLVDKNCFGFLQKSWIPDLSSFWVLLRSLVLPLDRSGRVLPRLLSDNRVLPRCLFRCRSSRVFSNEKTMVVQNSVVDA